MGNFLLKVGALCLMLSFSFSINAQTEEKPILVTVETLERDYNKPKEEPKRMTLTTVNSGKDFYRHHKRLPKTFEGFVIELTTSDFPLNRDYHLFEQFGEVYYEQVQGTGYAYLIVADFSSKKSIEQYVKNVVIHKAPEAKVFEYKKGKRIEK